jgi:hypothetical protein
MAGLGMEAAGSTPGEFAVLVRSDVAKWSRVVRESGIRVE